MSLPYLLRLLFISSAIFFLIHLFVGLAVRLASPKIIKASHNFQTRNAVRFLLAARFLPVGLASFVVLGLCVPSYFWLEPAATTEQISVATIFAGFLAIFLCAVSLFRALRAIAMTRKFTRACLKIGREQCLSADSSPVLVVEVEAPILAMAGVIRPQLVVSQSVLSSLPHDQLEAAIRHERAHRTSADNLKRLLLLMSPEIFPFVHAFTAIDHSWRKISEWAADDFAVENDSNRSLSLASALIRVAQMGASPRMSPLCTALISDSANTADADLADRVNRLLHQPPVGHSSPVRWTSLATGTAITLASSIVVVIFRPSTLHSVHQILERIIH